MSAPVAALVYLLITLALFRELVAHITTNVYAYVGDPLLNAAILAWNARVLPLTDAWWNFPSFAPLTGVTSFTEHLLLAYPVASPIIWLTGNPILAVNVLYLLAFVLNGLCAYALARELTGSRDAAFVAGLAFAFAPYQSLQATHVQMLMAFGIPLTLLGLHRWISSDRGASLYGSPGGPQGSALRIFGVGWLCSALANAYTLIFVPILVVLWCLWFVRPADWRRLIAPAAVALAVAAALAPLLLGYQSRQEAYGFVRTYDEIRFFGADITGVGTMFYKLSLWKGILPESFEEGAIFPGITIVTLGVIALLTCRADLVRSAQASLTPRHSAEGQARLALHPVPFYAVAAVVMWLLALGPEPEWNGTPIAYGPYRLLMELPGVSAIRVPARAWLLAALCLSVLAAFGTRALLTRLPRARLALPVVLGLLIVAEGWFVETTAVVPAVTRIDRAVPPGAVVLDVPIDESWWNAIPQYRAVMAGYRTISGYSGYEPPHFGPFRHAIADLDAEAINRYRRVDDLYVIIRPGQTPRVVEWLVGQPGAEQLFSIDGVLLYRLPRR